MLGEAGWLEEVFNESRSLCGLWEDIDAYMEDMDHLMGPTGMDLVDLL